MSYEKLCKKHTFEVVEALEAAITPLYLYAIGNRSVRGAFYDVVQALDKEMYKELIDNEPDWVYKKYFAEEDE